MARGVLVEEDQADGGDDRAGHDEALLVEHGQPQDQQHGTDGDDQEWPPEVAEREVRELGDEQDEPDDDQDGADDERGRARG